MLPLQMLTLLAQQLQWRLHLNKSCKRRLLRSVCDLEASADCWLQTELDTVFRNLHPNCWKEKWWRKQTWYKTRETVLTTAHGRSVLILHKLTHCSNSIWLSDSRTHTHTHTHTFFHRDTQLISATALISILRLTRPAEVLRTSVGSKQDFSGSLVFYTSAVHYVSNTRTFQNFHFLSSKNRV